MPNIVITSSTNRIYLDFNDLSIQAGLTIGDFQKSDVTTALNIGDIDVFFIVEGLFQWRFSYNGSIGSLQVDLIDGVAPIDNVDLKSKIDAILAIQTIPDQSGNAGKYLYTNGTDMSWQSAGSGSGLTQPQVLARTLGA